MPYRVMCMLRDEHKITLLQNVAEHKMARIARLCQTVVANGVTVIDKRFTLGQCRDFFVTNLSKEAREKGYKRQSGEAGAVVQDQFLVTIDGCNPALGCTIVLSGPSGEMDELQKLKKVVRKVLLTARNIYLETFYLRMIMANVEAPNPLPTVPIEDYHSYL